MEGMCVDKKIVEALNWLVQRRLTETINKFRAFKLIFLIKESFWIDSTRRRFVWFISSDGGVGKYFYVVMEGDGKDTLNILFKKTANI